MISVYVTVLHHIFANTIWAVRFSDFRYDDTRNFLTNFFLDKNVLFPCQYKAREYAPSNQIRVKEKHNKLTMFGYKIKVTGKCNNFHDRLSITKMKTNMRGLSGHYMRDYRNHRGLKL